MLGRQRDPDRLHQKGNVEGLLRALAPQPGDISSGFDEAVDVGTKRRARAAELLTDLDGATIDEGLRDALSDPEPVVRLAALRALVNRFGPAEANVIATAVLLPEGLREEAAAELATAARGPETAAVLLEVYVEETAEPGAAFADGWAADVARRLSPEGRRACVEHATYTLLLRPDSARAAQVQALDAQAAALATRDGLADPGQRLTALRRLGELRSAAALEEIVALVEDPEADADVRAAAIVALGQIKHPWAIEALLTATTDDEYQVRAAAMDAIDGFGTAGTVWGIATSARGMLSGLERGGPSGGARLPRTPAPVFAGARRVSDDQELMDPETRGPQGAGEHPDDPSEVDLSDTKQTTPPELVPDPQRRFRRQSRR